MHRPSLQEGSGAIPGMESGRGVGDGATACRDGRCMDIKERINEKLLPGLLVSSGRGRSFFLG